MTEHYLLYFLFYHDIINKISPARVFSLLLLLLALNFEFWARFTFKLGRIYECTPGT